MKKIEAIIRPEAFEPLKDALLAVKIDGITVNQVIGCGNQHGWTEHHRGANVIMNTISKVRIEMVISDNRLEEIIGIITDIAHTGEVGDGKIFISSIDDCIRIRTGERGETAI